MKNTIDRISAVRYDAQTQAECQLYLQEAIMSNEANEATKTRKKPTMILGIDLVAFHMKTKQSLTAVRNMLGVAASKWKDEAGSSAPIRDVTLSMLLRLYGKNPEMLQKGIDIHEFYRDIGGRNTISPSDFAIILGREGSAYTRWMSGTNNVSPTLQALIERTMHLTGSNARAAFDLIKELYEEERTVRGVDPLQDRRWSGPRTKKAAKPKVKKEVSEKPATKKATKKVAK